MLKRVFFGLCLLLFSPYGVSHEGHSHGSPSATSQSKFGDLATSIESPLVPSLKFRAGSELGQFVGVIPGLFSNFGDDELGLGLSYEFRLREFSAESKTPSVDRDIDHHFTLSTRKAVSDRLQFVLFAEYEELKANRISRALNDFGYSSINPTIILKTESDWAFGAGYVYGYRRFPNGSYAIPIPGGALIGEPIVPGDQGDETNNEIIRQSIDDAQHEAVLSATGSFGSNTLSLEGRQLLNYSTQKSREFNGQLVRFAFDRSLWKMAGGQLSQSFETRNLSVRRDLISISEVGVLQELNPKMSASSLVRFTQTQMASVTSWWEGYAQLQYIF